MAVFGEINAFLVVLRSKVTFSSFAIFKRCYKCNRSISHTKVGKLCAKAVLGEISLLRADTTVFFAEWLILLKEMHFWLF